MAELLCQDCLRSSWGDSYEAFKESTRCAGCGGELCGCTGCRELLRELHAGSRSHPSLQVDIKAWSPETGAVFYTEAELVTRKILSNDRRT